MDRRTYKKTKKQGKKKQEKGALVDKNVLDGVSLLIPQASVRATILKRALGLLLYKGSACLRRCESNGETYGQKRKERELCGDLD